MKLILGCIRKAVEDFDMIKDGDIVGVGVSGGKDSVALLYGLKLFQNFSPVKYKLKALSLTLGFDDFDLSPIQSLCNKLGIEYIIQPTQIGRIVFEERKEKNPCSLCSRFKRGALHDLCKENSITKLALGHHRDDAIETLFLSMFYEGRINTFNPVTYLSRKDLTMIRPMIYVEEREIAGAVKRHNLPIVKSPCPADGNTKREYMKKALLKFYKDIPYSKQNLLRALMNTEQLNIWEKKK
ncbi:tRNA 2-thiocytidine biosynthesis TtcA family protein [Paramaledivibacter caminithermalis]|uniref:tRNA(Ile)-lysidine synthase TilS/MesJ n=1 Tax=Paramaledivibacter caminithermalis (strain DSM 15212 / CIP 107654 / DViRD3) TaxID=1121301 RepID=A0A1M6L554_PARC5|nr:tRNA 2-thiocytidine biosynthesis TtcA family protein [Paramaledivibacter caminithermalis]SHJ66189.1 tRNA(Ile)-lysidine synthase TilS/MesJ [Paramaledivibacter caminithermalis DSM 15212]